MPKINTAGGFLIGHRVEIAPHYDLWMQGARFGTIKSFRRSVDGKSIIARIKMDHPQVKTLARIPVDDLRFA